MRGGAVPPKVDWEGVEVDAAGPGLSRFGSTSTCAARREGQGEKEVRGRRKGRTVLDPDNLVHEALVRQLGAQRRDHVDLAVDDDHRVDVAVRERRSRRVRRRLLSSHALEELHQSL